MSLTVVILTKNEAETIEKCIRSVQFADEILVIDDESEDRTAFLAKQNNARVITHIMKDFASQRTYGLSQASGDWILFLDADESISPQLAQEIASVVQ